MEHVKDLSGAFSLDLGLCQNYVKNDCKIATPLIIYLKIYLIYKVEYIIWVVKFENMNGIEVKLWFKGMKVDHCK